MSELDNQRRPRYRRREDLADGKPGVEPHRSPPRPAAQERILLVDDDASVRDSLAAVLVEEGFQIVLAADGQQALETIEKIPVDLVLLDLNMPRLNGWNTFEHLVGAHPLVPIVIIAARPNQLLLAASVGAGALLEKPLDIPFLLHTIRRLLDEPDGTRLRRRAGREAGFIYAGRQIK